MAGGVGFGATFRAGKVDEVEAADADVVDAVGGGEGGFDGDDEDGVGAGGFGVFVVAGDVTLSRAFFEFLVDFVGAFDGDFGEALDVDLLVGRFSNLELFVAG